MSVCGCRHCTEIDAARAVADRVEALEREMALDDWIAEHDSRYWPTLPFDHESDLLERAHGGYRPAGLPLPAVRRVGVCHRLDCPKFAHPAHAA